MPRYSPYVITLSRRERDALERRARKYTLPYCQVVRAHMILLAAEGRSNDDIAAALSIGRNVVSLWRKRFFEERLAALDVHRAKLFGRCESTTGIAPFEWRFTRDDLAALTRKLDGDATALPVAA